jgi:F-type H+-transporting ATPase subunit delta
VKNAGSKRIAARYVKALFDAASQAKALPAVEANLNALSAALAQSDELAQFVADPILSRSQKAAIIQALLKKMNAHELTVRFGAVLAENRRLALVPDVAALFSQAAQEARGEMSVRVASAAKLGKKECDAISEALGKVYGKKVHLQVQEDTSLIGGVVVNIGSIQLDGSLSGKLGRLRQKLRVA